MPTSSEKAEKVLTDEQIADLLQLHNSPLVRMLYLIGGFLALFLGILGIALPILPRHLYYCQPLVLPADQNDFIVN